MINMNSERIGCAYIRVSSEKQEEYSPDAQIRLLKEYAAANNIILTEIYQDLGISGRQADKRPEFIKMISECKAKEHPYDVILVWKFSRFARNQEESIVYKNLLKKNNVEVISVSEPIPEGFVGELVERIFEWMDEYYSIRLSGEVKRGMTQKVLSGGYNNRPPIGYKKEKGTNTVPEPDNYYADMVRMVFDMYVNEQHSFADIASKINERGYRTRRGNKWETRNIVDMIQNPFYIGKIRWNNTENRARSLSGETIIVEGKHTPLISQEIFDAANEKYNRMSALRNHDKRKTPQKHWLSGMIKCSKCGGSLAIQNGKASKNGNIYPYLVCYRYIKGMCDCRNSISLKKAEQYVIMSLEILIKNKKLNEIKPVKTYEPDKESYMLQLKMLKNKLQRIKDAYINGIDTLEEYKINKEKIQEEIDKIKNGIPKSSPAPVVTMEKIKKVYDFINSDKSNQEKAKALREIVSHIVYDKETDTMQIYLHGYDNLPVKDVFGN